MGGFGSENDLEKAGFLSVGEDSLSYEDRIKIVTESGYLGYNLENEEDLIKNDKEAEPVDWMPVRNFVFTVLDQAGNPIITEDSSVIDKMEIKKRARNIQGIKHKRLMREDPAYAKKWEARNDLMLSLLRGEPTDKHFFF